MTQCRCHINSFQPSSGAHDCLPCVGQAKPSIRQSSCETDIATTGLDVDLDHRNLCNYLARQPVSICDIGALAPFFLCAPLSFWYLFVRVDQTCAHCQIHKLLEAQTQQQQLTAGLLLNTSFMLFFWLGFGGKMARTYSDVDLAPDRASHRLRQ